MKEIKNVPFADRLAADSDEPEPIRKESTADEPADEKPVDKVEERKDTMFILIAIGVVILSLAVIFSLRLFAPDDVDQYTYRGFQFVNVGGLWVTDWQRGNDIFTIRLRNGPRESQDVPTFFGGDFNVSDVLYLTFDPGENLKFTALAAAELGLNLKRVFNLTPTAACTSNSTEACYNRPIITCDNTEEAVIYLNPAKDTGLFLDNNCITIQGTDEELVRAADKLIWLQYGILS